MIFDLINVYIYERIANSTLVSVRHTHFKAEIGVPRFPFTVGVKCVTRPRTEPCGDGMSTVTEQVITLRSEGGNADV